MIRISHQAEKQLKHISKIDQIILAKKIRTLSALQHIPNATKLEGYKDIYRIRIGDCRIVYRKRAGDVFIVLIGYRKDVYDQLDRMIL